MLCKTKTVAKLLGVSTSAMIDALTTRNVVTQGEIITKFNTLDESSSAREAMAKGLYSRLFDWIVQQINKHLSLGIMIL